MIGFFRPARNSTASFVLVLLPLLTPFIDHRRMTERYRKKSKHRSHFHSSGVMYKGR